MMKWRKRFYVLEKKPVKNPDFKALYQKQIKKYIENGYAKKIDKNELVIMFLMSTN